MFLVSVILVLKYARGPQPFVYFLNSGQTVNIEIADSPEEHALGLMYREYLDPDSGMLFVFDEPKLLSFWMQNTYIPLDILFIDETGKINTIHEDTIPKNSLNRYKSLELSKYALELNSGYTKEHGIKAGDYILINEKPKLTNR